MTMLPQSMAARIGVTLVVAAVAVVGLDLAVHEVDANVAAARPRRYAEPPLPPPVRLTAVAGSVLLGSLRAEVPAGAAPVIQVFRDGSYALRRPSPRPEGPEMAVCTAVILLPTPEFSRLDSRARATLAEILGALIPERPIRADRFVTIDFRVEQRRLENLLAWVR